MRDALAKAGAPFYLYAGEIWHIADEAITFADPDTSVRTHHQGRYVLVLQGDDVASNAQCLSVLVAPLSSNIRSKQAYEEFLQTNESPLSEPSIVKIHLLQPVPRRCFREGDQAGSIVDQALKRILAHIAINLGMARPATSP